LQREVPIKTLTGKNVPRKKLQITKIMEVFHFASDISVDGGEQGKISRYKNGKNGKFSCEKRIKELLALFSNEKNSRLHHQVIKYTLLHLRTSMME